jgi:hypothetical protein
MFEAKAPGSEMVVTGLEMSVEFCLSVSTVPQGIANILQNLATWGRRLYFRSEGSRASDFIAFKNPSLLAGFELANLGFNNFK